MEKHIDLQTFGDDTVRARGNGSLSESKSKQDFDQDRYELARVGKQQVLKVSPAPWIHDHQLTMSASLRAG